jgi:beta-xylosidase
VKTELKGNVPNGCGAIVVNEFDTYKILVWNHLPVQIKERENWDINIPLPDTKNKIITKATIRAGAGSAWESWKLMGSPINPTKNQFDLLWQHSSPDYQIVSSKEINGGHLSLKLSSNEVVLIELSPLKNKTGIEFEMTKEMQEWEKSMGEGKK